MENNVSVKKSASPINITLEPEDSMSAKISNQISIKPTTDSDSVKAVNNQVWKNMVGILQVISMILIFVGVIVGTIYMIKSKKTAKKKIVIGIAIIVIPIIISFLLNIIKIGMAIA